MSSDDYVPPDHVANRPWRNAGDFIMDSQDESMFDIRGVPEKAVDFMLERVNADVAKVEWEFLEATNEWRCSLLGFWLYVVTPLANEERIYRIGLRAKAAEEPRVWLLECGVPYEAGLEAAKTRALEWFGRKP